MPYEFRGDIAHADVAFDAWGESLDELFAAAASATLQVMVEDPARVMPVETVTLEMEQTDLEMLLFDFLNELVFYKDARRLLLAPSAVKIVETEGNCRLEAAMVGEEIAPGRHRLITDVKAVTMHRFSVRREGTRWHATVVLDV